MSTHQSSSPLISFQVSPVIQSSPVLSLVIGQQVLSSLINQPVIFNQILEKVTEGRTYGHSRVDHREAIASKKETS